MSTVQEYILATDQVVETNLPWEVANQLCNLLSAHFKVKFHIVTWNNDRETTTYYIKPSAKIKKPELHDAQIFVKGARAAWR